MKNPEGAGVLSFLRSLLSMLRRLLLDFCKALAQEYTGLIFYAPNSLENSSIRTTVHLALPGF